MKKLLIMMMGVFALGSCVQDGDLDPCPVPVSGIDITLYVERFNGTVEWPVTRAESIFETSEAAFGDRVEKLYYLLYREGVLVEKGAVTEPALVRSAGYKFSRDNLAPGDYSIYIMANCPDLLEDPVNPDEIAILYPGYDLTEDYFLAHLPFTVNENSRSSYAAQLKRLHGVVRFTFHDLDPSITKIDIHMDGLSSSGCILGTYSEDYEFNMSVPVTSISSAGGRASAETKSVVGLFPTMVEGGTTWDVKVHRNDGEPLYYEGVVTKDLSVLRNQLLDLRATFQNGGVKFEVSVDSEWDEANEEDPVIAD